MSPAADPYGLGEAGGWLLLLLFALALYGVARFCARRRKAAADPLHRGSEGSRRVATPPCHVTGCPVPGFATVVRVRYLGAPLETLRVCHGHADEGEAYGWWLREQGYRPVAS